jgi:hypothetical protein
MILSNKPYRYRHFLTMLLSQSCVFQKKTRREENNFLDTMFFSPFSFAIRSHHILIAKLTPRQVLYFLFPAQIHLY